MDKLHERMGQVKVLWKIISSMGLVLVVLGVASFGSPSPVIPVTMIASGALMVGVSVRRQEEWTEE